MTEEDVASQRKKQGYTREELESVCEKHSKWVKEQTPIRSKLQSYYVGTDIADRWNCYCAIINGYYLATLNYFNQYSDAKKDLEGQLKEIRDYFSTDKSINLDNLTTTYDEEIWSNVYDQLLVKGDEIIRDSLRLEIKAF